MELLTTELSASYIVFDEEVDAEVASAKVVLEDKHISNLLDVAAQLDTKLATELANIACAYEVMLVAELGAIEDEYARKVCIVEYIFQRMLAEEKVASEKCYLKYNLYMDMYHTQKAAKQSSPPMKGDVPVT